MDIVLEKIRFTEAEDVHTLWSDEDATLYTNFPYLTTIEECKLRLKKMESYYSQNAEHFGPFAIRSTDGQFLVLTGGDASPINGEFEIWYFIKRDMWKKKIATSAVAKLLEMMKKQSLVKLIKAEAVVDNKPSWLFLEKIGFQRTDVLPAAHKKNGKTWDRYVYSMSNK